MAGSGAKGSRPSGSVVPTKKPGAMRLRFVPPVQSARLRAPIAQKVPIISGEAVSVGSIAKAENLNAYYASRLLRVAFLAPDLKRAILEGRQPAAMNLQAIMTRDLPLAWDAQRTHFRS